MSPLSRRRFIRLMAATAGAAHATAAFAAAPPVQWRGSLMGATAQIDLQGVDAARGAAIIARCLAEARRLERIFSLYDESSSLSACNRQGFLVAPPAEFVALLRQCQTLHSATLGRFDPTVQPLFAFYARHFAGDNAPPDRQAVAAVLARVGLEHVLVSDARIALARPGMALTFNGIAQGFITDRISDRLREEGLAHCLVDLGETRATGPQQDGGPWRIGIAAPGAPERIAAVQPLRAGAAATSCGDGFVFPGAAGPTHILDPASVASAPRGRSVTVFAPTAAQADGLSTGFALLPDAMVADALLGLPGVSALLIDGDHAPRLLGAPLG